MKNVSWCDFGIKFWLLFLPNGRLAFFIRSESVSINKIPVFCLIYEYSVWYLFFNFNIVVKKFNYQRKPKM